MPANLLDKIPRGIRNNNPGNIEYNPNTKWQGLASPLMAYHTENQVPTKPSL
jgi:hypothetical protein